MTVASRPESDGEWGANEKIAASEQVSPLALPELALRTADLD